MTDTIDTIYLACSIRRIKDSDHIQYIPIYSLSDDLSSISIAAASDLCSVQLKNMGSIATLILNGIPAIILPISVQTFKEVSETIRSRLTITISAYIDAMNEYKNTVGLLGDNKNDGDSELSFYMFNSIVTKNPACVLSEDYEIVEPERFDVLTGIYEAFSNYIGNSSGDAAIQAILSSESDYNNGNDYNENDFEQDEEI